MHEYDVVKNRAGLFAMQHKALVRLTGPDAGALVETLLCGDVRRLPETFDDLKEIQREIRRLCGNTRLNDPWTGQ